MSTSLRRRHRDRVVRRGIGMTIESDCKCKRFLNKHAMFINPLILTCLLVFVCSLRNRGGPRAFLGSVDQHSILVNTRCFNTRTSCFCQSLRCMFVLLLAVSRRPATSTRSLHVSDSIIEITHKLISDVCLICLYRPDVRQLRLSLYATLHEPMASLQIVLFYSYR